MLRQPGDWMKLESVDEQKPIKVGIIEARRCSKQNPIGNWYRLKKSFRGRFEMYIPLLMEALGLFELPHNTIGNQMMALSFSLLLVKYKLAGFGFAAIFVCDKYIIHT